MTPIHESKPRTRLAYLSGLLVIPSLGLLAAGHFFWAVY